MQVVRRRDERDEVLILGLIGDLDLASVPVVRSAAIEAAADGWSAIVVDLTEVAFIDSAGMGSLIGIRRRCRAAGGDCVLARTSDEVARQLAHADLDRLFPSFERVDEAVVAVRVTAS